MLKTFREAQPWIIKMVMGGVVLAFIGTIFFAWGMGGQTARNTLATVEGTAITLPEFQTAYQNLYNFYQQQYKDRFTPELAQTLGLKRQVLDNLIQRHLLLQEAQKEGLVVTNAELIAHIQEYPAFQVEGKFDKERYRRLLQLNRLSPGEFEQQQKHDLLIAKLERMIMESVRVSEAELKEAYAREYGKIKFRFLTLTPPFFESDINAQILEEEIEKYYQENKELFRKPEQIQVSYLLVESKPFEDQVTITEEAVTQYYNAHKEDYRREERVRARHILIKVDPAAKPEEEEQAKARAEEILRQVKAEGADFAQIAKEVSEDPSSAQQGGDLGYFGRGAMVKPFEEMAFTLQPGEISPLVRTNFGYHIIRVEDKQEAGYQPLEEIKMLLTEQLKREEVDKLVRTRAEALLEEIKAQGGNLEAVGQKEGITIFTTPFFARTERQLPGIMNASLFVKTAFALQEDEVSTPLKLGRDYYLLKIVARKAPHVPEFAEIQEEVRAKLIAEKSNKAAAEKAEALDKDLTKGASLQDIAQSLDLKVQETGFLTRRDPIPEIGRNPTLLDTVFQMKKGESKVIPSGDKYYIVQIDDQQLFDEEDYTKKRPELEQRLQAMKETLVFQAWLERLRKQAEISINEELMALL